jgi:hypothetical protein
LIEINKWQTYTDLMTIEIATLAAAEEEEDQAVVEWASL